MKKISKRHRLISAAVAITLLFSGIKCSKPSDSSIRARVVQINGETRGGCSGEQIEAPSGDMYILTAAHCMGLADSSGNMNIVTEDGRELKRRIITEDPHSDLLLVEGVPGIPGLRIGKSLERFEHVRTFTHGRLFPTYKTEGEVIGKQEIFIAIGQVDSADSEASCASKSKYKAMDTSYGKLCVLVVEETAVTARIAPGSSGGPMVNDDGELVGVASASDSEGQFGLMVNLEHIQDFLSGY